MQVWTIGHSTQAVEALIDTVRTAEISILLDVRRYPASRRHPQFNSASLAASLAQAGIAYEHVPALGGRRQPLPDSFNQGLRDRGFRGFADYMWSEEFESALTALIERAAAQRVAVMCAEALPWRCHRSLIADALVARGVEVVHLLAGKERRHTLSPSARLQEGRVAYPALL